jgi:hypothetical protein
MKPFHQDLTATARANGYTGTKPVIVCDGKVTSHRNADWFAWLARQKRRAGRFVTIVLRGCLVRVSAERAPELQRREQLLLAEDWNNNRL